MCDIYDSSFLCTYKNIDDDDLYRIQFLQAFKTQQWDDNEINKKITLLHAITREHFSDTYKKIMVEESVISHMLLFLGIKPNEIDLFQTLFTMDMFQETHACICDILNHQKVSDSNYRNFTNTLFKNKK